MLCRGLVGWGAPPHHTYSALGTACPRTAALAEQPRFRWSRPCWQAARLCGASAPLGLVPRSCLGQQVLSAPDMVGEEGGGLPCSHIISRMTTDCSGQEPLAGHLCRPPEPWKGVGGLLGLA